MIAVFFLLPAVNRIHAQEQRIVFPHRTVIVEDAFKEIERQTEVLISMNRSNFNFNKKVKLTHNNLPLGKALEQLLAKTGRTYVIKGNHVLIIPVKQPVETAVVEPFSQPEENTAPSANNADDSPKKISFVFRELDLNKPPMDLDSLERALHSKKIDYPAETPSEPFLNQTLYYRQRDREGFTPGEPAYTRNLPKYAIRTNLLYAAAAFTPNVGAEFNLGHSSTILGTFSYNGWNRDGSATSNEKLCHWIAQAEYRHWLCESFNGHFFGANAYYGYYNISEKKIPLILESNSDKYRYKGNVMGVGLSYGYQMMLAPRWNLEFNIGFSVGRMKYDKWDCVRCGNEVEKMCPVYLWHRISWEYLSFTSLNKQEYLPYEKNNYHTNCFDLFFPRLYAPGQGVEVINTSIEKKGDHLWINFDMVPGKFPSNHSVMIRPVIYNGDGKWLAAKTIRLVGRKRDVYDRRVGDIYDNRYVIRKKRAGYCVFGFSAL